MTNVVLLLEIPIIFRNKKIFTTTGSTNKTDSNMDMDNVVNHSSDFCLPHSVLYSTIKNADTLMTPRTSTQPI